MVICHFDEQLNTFQIMKRKDISSLGRSGLIIAWDRLELNVEYKIPYSFVIEAATNMLMFLDIYKIKQRAADLDAEIITWEDPIECFYYIKLIKR